MIGLLLLSSSLFAAPAKHNHVIDMARELMQLGKTPTANLVINDAQYVCARYEAKSFRVWDHGIELGTYQFAPQKLLGNGFSSGVSLSSAFTAKDSYGYHHKFVEIGDLLLAETSRPGSFFHYPSLFWNANSVHEYRVCRPYMLPNGTMAPGFGRPIYHEGSFDEDPMTALARQSFNTSYSVELNKIINKTWTCSTFSALRGRLSSSSLTQNAFVFSQSLQNSGTLAQGSFVLNNSQLYRQKPARIQFSGAEYWFVRLTKSGNMIVEVSGIPADTRLARRSMHRSIAMPSQRVIEYHYCDAAD